MKFGLAFIAVGFILMFGNPIDKNMSNTTAPFTYLALGDSYTIGEAVAQKDSFPFQLVNQLGSQKLKFAEPRIIARTGWTTAELQQGIAQADRLLPPYDLVTLLIGVNNQYRGLPIATYRKEFKALLAEALTFAGGNKKRVFVLSIPDWGVTPFASKSGRSISNIAQEIDAFNAVAKTEASAMGIAYIDITPGSRKAATMGSLLAGDGLHPSGKMYGEWVSALLPEVAKTF